MVTILPVSNSKVKLLHPTKMISFAPENMLKLIGYEFFIDTANLDQIREANDLGVLDGVTTNPSLMAKKIFAEQKTSKTLH
jgi:hypothetical protein